jgi:hypothetical protein
MVRVPANGQAELIAEGVEHVERVDATISPPTGGP